MDLLSRTDLGSATPVLPSRSTLSPIEMDAVRLRSGHLAQAQERNGSATIDHCEYWIERIGWLANFDDAADPTTPATHSGIEFVDSEVYKLLEAMAWELHRTGDADLASRYASIVARVAAAQADDGYLNTSFGRAGQPGRWSDLEWGHELYCAGHLIQAAVARLRTGFDDLLVDVARRVAGNIAVAVDGPLTGVCGHPEIEVALTEFSRATGDSAYLDLARLLLERRGHRTLATTLFQSSEYFLDDVPVRDAEVLRGHAVRALYLAAGAIDIGVDTADGELVEAVADQYARTLARRTYVTGGMGSHHQNEEFGDDFELPADRAYSETCAGIASMMVAWRLLLETGDERYADALENVLYNVVLASPREDGCAFYYTNTLHQRELGSEPEPDGVSQRAESSLRAPWFDVSCCPTNVARTLAAVNGYVATTTERGVQLHLFADGRIDAVTGDGTAVALDVVTGYPFNGAVEVTVLDDVEFELSMRIPEWAAGRAEATSDERTWVPEGDRLVIDRPFRAGDRIVLRLPDEVRSVSADPRVDAVRGCRAFLRGPLVLCVESTDLPDGLDVNDLALVSGDAADTESWPAAVRLTTFDVAESTSTFSDTRPSLAAAEFTAPLIPYYQWANRGPSTMRIWIPEA